LTICTYDVAQLLLSSLTGVLTLVATGHLGLKGLRNYLQGEKFGFDEEIFGTIYGVVMSDLL
jgi:hypothetical protein